MTIKGLSNLSDATQSAGAKKWMIQRNQILIILKENNSGHIQMDRSKGFNNYLIEQEGTK